MKNAIVPLTPELLKFVLLAERDPLLAEMCSGEHFAARALNRWGYALLGRGLVLAAGGLIPMWAGRVEAWLLVHREASPRDLVPALRHADAVMTLRQRDPFFRRIEAYVRCGEPYTDAFVRVLGMKIEGRMAAWDPKGRDYFLCARVAHG